ncbi:hypothetical protein BU24DRAFT_425198 [Aaosphaeria arxii CBS 175.79]|uniref:Transmembrane protein n=1 Tax=Aaosphaeria arxii CBS 175.79 TaxID=1450172 RepID=A0A6A5XI82_9PLEO|nr:uncharacterized protein BU24DRAFT_425198 [Aaosphaeria arxii CBS 175.79]KAF2012557.1 hypothetical protein BU24DRAFT_425198 [Aaosphaeria arxii CBS 175.79]
MGSKGRMLRLVAVAVLLLLLLAWQRPVVPVEEETVDRASRVKALRAYHLALPRRSAPSNRASVSVMPYVLMVEVPPAEEKGSPRGWELFFILVFLYSYILGFGGFVYLPPWNLPMAK